MTLGVTAVGILVASCQFRPTAFAVWFWMSGLAILGAALVRA
jgi:hypothetical protein